ncbi:MAG: hypothetical protein M4579_001472 [Chaenotheca gracillima]|nr:MAG: hypothetical protein M4579_001472 [Chaenotheca gracillima]
MGKSKPSTPSTNGKHSSKSLSAVKDGAVIKSSKTPKVKSAELAKKVAAKSDKKSKKSKGKKEPTPTPSSSEESDSDESMSSASSASESEAEVKKPVNGKTNGVAKAAKAESGTSDSSESSESSASSDDSSDDSTDDEGKPAASKSAAAKIESSDDDSGSSSDESSGNESDDEVEKAPAAKGAAAAKPSKAAKKDASSDEDSDDSEDSAEDSDDSDSSEKGDEESAPKKRKAESAEVPAVKKVKAEESGPTSLFVGNLSWNIDEEWLAREFEEFGEIAGSRIVTDRESGRSRGFGYVEFSNAADAAKALEGKKGQEIDGRIANVDFSTPRPSNDSPRDQAKTRASNFGDSTSPPSSTLFVGNVSFEANEDMIGESFSSFGEILSIRLPTDQTTGAPKGFGYVEFSSVDEAKAALDSMQGSSIGGRAIRLDFSTPRSNTGGSPRGGGRGGFGDRGGRGGGRGRGGFGDRGGRGGRGGRGDRGGSRGGSTNRGGFGDFKGQKKTF